MLVLLCLTLAGCSRSPTQQATPAVEIDASQIRNQAEAAYAAGEWREAGQRYEQLIKVIPQESRLWFRLGNIYARTERPDAAIRAYREALVRDAADGKAWFNMGIVQLRQAANSFLKMQSHVDGDDAIAVQGKQAYDAVMAILGGGGNTSGTAEPQATASPARPAIEAAESDETESVEAESSPADLPPERSDISNTESPEDLAPPASDLEDSQQPAAMVEPDAES